MDGNNLAMTGGGRRSSKGGGMFARAKASEQARDVERMNAEVGWGGVGWDGFSGSCFVGA